MGSSLKPSSQSLKPIELDIEKLEIKNDPFDDYYETDDPRQRLLNELDPDICKCRACGKLFDAVLAKDRCCPNCAKRVLNSKWTVDMEQDIKCMYGIDIHEELVNVISNEIRDEIDEHILKQITGDKKCL